MPQSTIIQSCQASQDRSDASWVCNNVSENNFVLCSKVHQIGGHGNKSHT